jgi:coenzyme PQQ synthesis protein D (PqqD)
MDADTSFRVNEPGVISEVIEGEAIVLNFASGTYYSMNHSLQLLWEGMTQGLSKTQLATLLEAHYPDAGGSLAQDVESALGLLVAEELIVANDDAAGGDPQAVTAVDKSPGNKTAYEAPQIQKYTDLQELLLLDPIHDVDEAGQAFTGI